MQMGDEKIEAVRDWPEPKSIRDIQVCLSFTNFYLRFIQGFGKIAALLTSMLKTTRSAKNLSFLMAENAKIGSLGGGDCENKTVERSPLTSKNSSRTTGYLILETRLAFTSLRKAFTKATIFQHFDPECHIRIEINVSGYAIVKVLNQLTLDNLG